MSLSLPRSPPRPGQSARPLCRVCADPGCIYEATGLVCQQCGAPDTERTLVLLGGVLLCVVCRGLDLRGPRGTKED
jgi:hypothetical protein